MLIGVHSVAGRVACLVLVLAGGLAGQSAPKTVITPWDLQGGDRFGTDLAVSDQWLMVGSPADDLIGRDSGSVAAFEKTSKGWQQRDILAPASGKSGEFFGSALALSENVCAIGAPWDSTAGKRSGAVYMFEWDGEFWNQIHKFHAPDAGLDQRFGHALDFDGTTLVVGARSASTGGKATGAAYIFEESATGGWSFTQKLKVPEVSEGAEFGFSVSVDGPALAIGAWADHFGGKPSGSVHIYRSISGDWTHEARLEATDNAPGACFGLDVDLVGEHCAVGSPWENTGAEHSGAAYIWKRGEQGWFIEQHLRPPFPQAEGSFGIAVRLNDEQQLILGARRGSAQVRGAGSASIYRWQGSSWIHGQTWSAPKPVDGDDFGLALGSLGPMVLVGARRADPRGGKSDSGCMYLSWPGGGPPQPENLTKGASKFPLR
jgi:hypothetical protein